VLSCYNSSFFFCILDAILFAVNDVMREICCVVNQNWCRNCESTISDVLAEKASFARMVEALQHELKMQDDELMTCRGTVSELMTQLASSHQAREEGALRAAR
jgi:hypothetical protein